MGFRLRRCGRFRSDLLPELRPLSLPEPIDPEDDSRRASVDPGIQSLVALPDLLPLLLAVPALGYPGDQLFGGELFEELIADLREVAVAGRVRLAIQRRRQAEPAVHLALERPGRNRPHANAARHALPDVGHVHGRRQPNGRSGVVHALDDQNPARPLLARPVVDVLRSETRIDGKPLDGEIRSMGVAIRDREQVAQLAPDRCSSGVPIQDDVIDQPALLPFALGDELHLDPVFLYVGGGSQKEAAGRHRVDELPQRLLRFLILEELPGQRAPLSPGGIERIHPEAASAALRVGGPPLAWLEHLALLPVLDLPGAVTLVVRILRFALWPEQSLPPQDLILATMRARRPETTLV